MRRILLAANSRSGRGQGQHLLQQAVQAGKRIDGLALEIIESEYDGHLLEALPAALEEPWERVIALGGDGTLFQTVNSCMQIPSFDGSIGLIPAGTGNSFSREFTDHEQDPFDRAFCGAPRPIDLVRCRLDSPDEVYGSEFYFLTVTGLGFVSDATISANRFKKLGVLSYALAVITNLVNLKTSTTTILIDGDRIERESVFLIAGNSRYTGGNMLVSPDARIDDGEIELLVLNNVGRMELLRAFPKVFSGEHISHPKFEIHRGHTIRIESSPKQMATPDGEVVGTTPLSFEVLPRKLKFIL